MAINGLYLSIAFLVFCNGQDIKIPLAQSHPIDVVKQSLSQSGQADKEIVDLIKQLPSALEENLEAAFINNSTHKCLLSLADLFDDLKQLKPYAVQVVDAWGKLESGFLRGNTHWSGLYHECVDAQSTNFSGKYCQIYVGKPIYPGQLQPHGVKIGSCFPDTCSASVIQPLLPATPGNNLTVNIQCPTQYTEWKATEIGGLFILSVLVALVISSTGYEYVSGKMDKAKEASNTALLLNDSSLPPSRKAEHGTFHRLLTSFSLIQNTKRLLDTKQRPTDITWLHGIRFLSMSWVILAHSFLYCATFSNNPLFLADFYLNDWTFQAIGNAFFSVDTFFFLSGLLVVYLGLRTLEQRHGRMNVPMMYLLRYLRLTPAYAFVLFMMVSVYPHLGGGPSWPGIAEGLKAPCREYWYTNLLYFSNLYPVGDLQVECFGWGWYLSNDTQFYLLAPLFLYLFYKWPLFGLGSALATLTSSIAITGIFSSVTHQQPHTLAIALMIKNATRIFHVPVNDTGGNFTTPSPHPTPAQYSPYMQDLYTKPWCRIGAYIVGLMTGYVLHTYKKIKIPKIVVVLCWVMAAVTSCLLLYGIYPAISQGELLDNNTAAFYNAVSRPLWCAAMAWVTIACVNGYGGPINTLLSWKAFIPLSRLTYCAYLVHLLVIYWLLATQDTFIHLNMAVLVAFYSATLVLANMVAYVVAMLAEFPIISLMKILQESLISKPRSQVERAFLVNGGQEQDGGQTDA